MRKTWRPMSQLQVSISAQPSGRPAPCSLSHTLINHVASAKTSRAGNDAPHGISPAPVLVQELLANPRGRCPRGHRSLCKSL